MRSLNIAQPSIPSARDSSRGLIATRLSRGTRGCAAPLPRKRASTNTTGHSGSGARAGAPGGAPAAAAAAAPDVFVLDFDGVLVDSEPEVSAAAFDAAADRWPSVFASPAAAASGQPASPAARERVLEGLRRCRPVLVRGYESVVMARLLAERGPAVAEDILNGWPALLPATLAEWGEDWQVLQKDFESHRAGWVDRDLQGWLACNKPYPGVKEALASCDAPFYIASSKAAHRVALLSTEALGLPLEVDSPRLFASLLPPEEKKVEALRTIASRPVAQGARLHFVDDRLDTLAAADAAGLRAEGWRLYLAEWGYATPEERAAAVKLEADGVLTRLALPAFLELLKWGVVMGVDDGCEPSAEEVAAGVRG